MQKCTHWLGHKFEGRYSKGASNMLELMTSGRMKITGQKGVAIVEAHRPVTYERDVCVRCGATVEKVK